MVLLQGVLIYQDGAAGYIKLLILSNCLVVSLDQFVVFISNTLDLYIFSKRKIFKSAKSLFGQLIS